MCWNWWLPIVLTFQLCPCTKNGNFWCMHLQMTILTPTWWLLCHANLMSSMQTNQARLPCVLNWAQLLVPDNDSCMRQTWQLQLKKGIPKNWSDLNGCLHCKRASKNNKCQWWNEKHQLPTSTLCAEHQQFLHILNSPAGHWLVCVENQCPDVNGQACGGGGLQMSAE